MNVMGFNTSVPQQWNRWWLMMWGVVAVLLLGAAFFLPFERWAVAAVIGFGIPEAISLIKRDDGYPPLTHTIRHFLPGWLTFILIYSMFGSIAATWLGFPRPFHLGALFGLLGWLTEHFSATYSKPDPFPFSGTDRPELETRRLPL